jgi:hypothetical protein
MSLVPMPVRLAAVKTIFNQNLLPGLPPGEGALLAFFPMRSPGREVGWITNGNFEEARQVANAVIEYIDEKDGIKPQPVVRRGGLADNGEAVERACKQQHTSWDTYRDGFKDTLRDVMRKVLAAAESAP